MLQYVVRHAGLGFESLIADPTTFETLILARLRSGPSFAAPPVLHAQVPFRYVAGSAFVAALYRAGVGSA
jgi:hypothetical protein